MSVSQQTQLTPMQRALLVVKKLEAERDAALGALREPIAIIGMACRFPGGARDPQSYWDMLQRDRDVIVEIPAARLPGLTLEGPSFAGLLEDVEGFDREFFGLSAAEVEPLDVQHRLLLEVAWHALEDAGIKPSELEGSRTGSFVGLCAPPAQAARPDRLQGVYALTGSGACFAAGRLAYYFGLRGPSMAVDTACSSSLVAVDLACKSLRLRESDLALAGGVNVILSASTMASIAATGALSPSGVCRPFDAGANGFVRAEGCGMVVLKRLRDAQRDGDRVWATIVGSSVNQDGRSSGLTAPNGAAQEDLLRDALRTACIKPEQVGYIEAHGTGTSLGDPIELEALRAVYGAPREDGSRCALGSLKSVFGHLEAAAGIASLMKAALVLWHGTVPKQTHFSTLNPRISLDGTCLEVPRASRALGGDASTGLAAVSSFGMSGTNVHVLLARAPEGAQSATAGPTPTDLPQLFTCSAHSAEALAARLRDTATFLDAQPALNLASICDAARTRRAQLPYRAAIVARDVRELSARAARLSSGESSDGCARGHNRERGTPKVALLFSGQGSQYPGMARELYEHDRAFRATVDRCIALLDSQLGARLLPTMFGHAAGDERLELTQYAQPALFIVQYAVAELLRTDGVEPALLIGHSVGELVAACVAGVLELPDALRLVAARGRLMAEHAREGAMLAVRAAPELVSDELKAWATELAIAAINGPDQLVLAGSARSIAAVEARLQFRKLKTKRLSVSHAFHSPAMDPVLEPFLRVAEQLHYQAPRIPLISNVDGAPGTRFTAPHYWVEQIRKPVLFHAGVESLLSAGVRVCIECGPKPTLLAMANQSLEQAGVVGIPTLREGRSDAEQLALARAGLYVAGVTLRAPAAQTATTHEFVSLPLYPFERAAQSRARPRRAPLASAAQPPVQSSAASAPGARAREQSASVAPLCMPRLESADRLVTPPLASVWEAIAKTDPRLVELARRIDHVAWSDDELFFAHPSLVDRTAAERERASSELPLAVAVAWLAALTGKSYGLASAASGKSNAALTGRLRWCARRWISSAPGTETVDILAFDERAALAVELLEVRLTVQPRTTRTARAVHGGTGHIESSRARNGFSTATLEAL